jgi:endonuclease G
MKYRHLVFVFLSAALLVSCGKDNPNPTPQPEPGGGGGAQPALILSQDFTKGMGKFTVQDKEKGGFEGSIWKFDSANAKYGVQATASKGSGSNYKAESWLISPEIDLTKYTTDVYLYFDHAFAYLSKDDKVSDPKEHFMVKVSADDGATWQDREVPKWLVPYSYFELAQSGNVSLSAFKGKKIKIAFIYKSTTEFAPTWEITNLTVSTERQVVLPDDAGDQYKSVPAWMELPQVTNASAWHAHTTILRFDRVRDYSFSYNEPCLVSDWVAYPLYADFAKDRVDRSNSNWEKDPFLSKQCDVTTGSYPDVNYDRGHQIPSADRAGGAMTNQHTFYCSNVTPQLHDFNGGVWEELEKAVRKWSSTSDTLYVVTGCMVDSDCPTVLDRSKQKVAVPKAYYKALLRLKGGSYIAAGFYLKHENTTKEYKEFAMSVKDLETKTGITFFVNLPTDKAAAIKAEDPTTNKFWGLK